MEFKIRKGRLSDGPDVVELWKGLIDHHRDLTCYDMEMTKDAPEIWRKWYERHVRSPKRRAAVAEADGRIIGYFLGAIDSRPELFKRREYAHIYDTYVLEEWRRKGVAAALLDDFTAWGKEKGIDWFTVYYSPENPHGLGFWHGSGFTDILITGQKYM